MKQLSGQGLCSGPRETTTWSPISTISLKGTRSHPEWLRNLGGLQKASNRNSWTRRPAATTTFFGMKHEVILVASVCDVVKQDRVWMMLHSGSRNIGNARLFDPRQSAFALQWYGNVLYAYCCTSWRDVTRCVFSCCFGGFFCLLNLVWSETLLQKGHCSALWPDCSKAVDDLRAVENFIVGTKHLVNLNRLRCGSGPESLAYLRHSSTWKSSRSIVSSVLHLFYVVKLHSCRIHSPQGRSPTFQIVHSMCNRYESDKYMTRYVKFTI